jgi:hypothetical protein
MEGFVTLIVLVLFGWAGWWATGQVCPDHHFAAFLLLILCGGLRVGGKD